VGSRRGKASTRRKKGEGLSGTPIISRSPAARRKGRKIRERAKPPLIGRHFLMEGKSSQEREETEDRVDRSYQKWISCLKKESQKKAGKGMTKKKERGPNLASRDASIGRGRGIPEFGEGGERGLGKTTSMKRKYLSHLKKGKDFPGGERHGKK